MAHALVFLCTYIVWSVICQENHLHCCTYFTMEDLATWQVDIKIKQLHQLYQAVYL